MRTTKEIENELKEFWGVSTFKFEAQYAVNRNGKGYFWNLRNIKDYSLVLFPNKKRVTISAPPYYEYEENESYIIHSFVAPKQIRERFKDDYVLFLDTKNNEPKKLQHDAKTFINELKRQYYAVTETPLDALRGALRRITTDINRKPETFIFELLQNADDYPVNKGANVIISFQIIDEYLLFKHNGLPFKANNVRAICSVDAGDKARDFEKIGYKGIGFKAIFKHSNFVLIDSGEFVFRFDENFHLNHGIDTVWQLVPIWTDKNEIPEILKKHLENRSNVNIAIRPEEGFEQLISYESTFNEIFKDERVLLFLRNVKEINFTGKNSSFTRIKDLNKWLISDLPSVKVPEEQVIKINNSIGKDDRIPEKYKDIDVTKITFSTIIENGKIEKTEDTRIFAYLPTDLNFGFPFLLNGDFIPDGGRHYLHADLEWNQFLFEQTGIQLLNWISVLWKSRKEDDIFKMLPTETDLIVEKRDDEKEVLLSCFKAGISSSKEKIAFIPYAEDDLKYAGEIILDDTGVFSENCLGPEIFYDLFKTPKYLPLNSNINDYLKIDYLDIERFTKENLVECLSNLSNKEKIKNKIASLDERQYKAFIKKINSLSAENNNWLLTLPIIKFGDTVFDIKSLNESKTYILNFKKISEIENILEKINLNVSDVQFDDYSNLFALAQANLSYVNKNKELFSFIETNGKFASLDKKGKSTILEFFNSLEDVGLRSCEKLQIFKNKTNSEKLVPLNNLISSKIKYIPQWLYHLVIDEDEEQALNEDFKKLLVKESDWLEKLYCNEALFEKIVEQLEEVDLPYFYNHLVNLKKDLPEDKKLIFNSIPWFYCITDKTFKLPSEIYANDSLLSLNDIDYQYVSNILMDISDENLPCFDSLKIITPFKLGCKKDSVNLIYKKEGTFSYNEIQAFLDWVTEKDFFEVFEIEKDGENYKLKKCDGSRNYYTSNDDLKSLIEKSELTGKLKLLPSELYNQERIKIGLLDG